LEAVEKSYAERKQLPEGRCQLEAAGKIQQFSWENDGKSPFFMGKNYGKSPFFMGKRWNTHYFYSHFQ